MIPIDRFDPFNDRLCRNVRNALSEAFTTSVAQRDLGPVDQVARQLLNDAPPACVGEYIHQRLAAYAAVLAVLNDEAVTEPLDVALAIWDRRLFFETHEYLEPYWMAAGGGDKRLLQALIRAAGTYVHLERGNRAAARRIAGKAIDGIARDPDRLAAHADPQRLLDKLRALDPEPPTLSGTATSVPGE